MSAVAVKASLAVGGDFLLLTNIYPELLPRESFASNIILLFLLQLFVTSHLAIHFKFVFVRVSQLLNTRLSPAVLPTVNK